MSSPDFHFQQQQQKTQYALLLYEGHLMEGGDSYSRFSSVTDCIWHWTSLWIVLSFDFLPNKARTMTPASSSVVKLMLKFIKKRWTRVWKVLQKHVSLLEWFCGTVLHQSSIPAVFPKLVSFQVQLHMYEDTLLNKDASLQKVGFIPSHEVLWKWLALSKS